MNSSVIEGLIVVFMGSTFFIWLIHDCPLYSCSLALGLSFCNFGYKEN